MLLGPRSKLAHSWPNLAPTLPTSLHATCSEKCRRIIHARERAPPLLSTTAMCSYLPTTPLCPPKVDARAPHPLTRSPSPPLAPFLALQLVGADTPPWPPPELRSHHPRSFSEPPLFIPCTTVPSPSCVIAGAPLLFAWSGQPPTPGHYATAALHLHG